MNEYAVMFRIHARVEGTELIYGVLMNTANPGDPPKWLRIADGFKSEHLAAQVIQSLLLGLLLRETKQAETIQQLFKSLKVQ